MRNYLAPGIYRAQQPMRADTIRLVRTDIAGFAGYAERGPVAPVDSPSLPDPSSLAVRITSWHGYQSIFGGHTRYGYLSHAVRAFFENGGVTCYVVRIAASSSANPFDRPQTASFAWPAGDVTRQATTLSEACNVADKTLAVASTANLSQGAVLQIVDGDLLIVGAVDDALHCTLTSPLTQGAAAGAPVRLVEASVLPAGAYAGQTDVHVSTSAPFHAGDAVTITSPGMIEVSVVDGIPDPATVRLTGRLKGNYPAGALLRRQGEGLRFEAQSPGNWGNRLSIDVTPRAPGALVTNIDLIVTLAPSFDSLQPAQTERFPDLSLDSLQTRFAPDVVNDPIAGSKLIRMTAPSMLALKVAQGRIFLFPVALSGGRDGLAAVTVRDFVGGDGDFRGLRVLEEIDEVAILLAPDVVNPGQVPVSFPPAPVQDPCQPPLPAPPPDPVAEDPTAPPPALAGANGGSAARTVLFAMSDQARRLRFRVAILDAPDRLQPADMSAWVTACGIPARNAPFSAIYYPWVASPADTNVPPPVRRLPPSGHVAGVYAQVDNTMGVQHPPANVELRFAVDVVKSLSAAQDGLLNEQGINVIRAFPGYGIRVWGARSLASRDDFQPQWWFIHVRRTLSMIEDSVRKSMRWTVFQPNNDDLRRMLTHSLDVLLQQLWLSGGLKGASPAEAYFVRCDASNNPQSQIDRGWLVCEVGVAVAAPLEFLTFLIRQSPGSAAQVED